MWGSLTGRSHRTGDATGPQDPRRPGTRHCGDLVVPRDEAWTVDGVTVHGNVVVHPGASLRLNGSRVQGHLECAISSMVIVRDSRIEGPVTVAPAPVETATGDVVRGGTALLNTQVGSDVRSTGTPRAWASLILGGGTAIDGSVLTGHTDLVDHGATVRVTVWNTSRAETIDLTADRPAVRYDVNGIAS